MLVFQTRPKELNYRENETDKIFSNQEIKTDHLFLARSDIVLINKKNELSVNFTNPMDHWGKMKESKKIDEYLDLARELEKTVENEGDRNISCSWCT